MADRFDTKPYICLKFMISWNIESESVVSLFQIQLFKHYAYESITGLKTSQTIPGKAVEWTTTAFYISCQQTVLVFNFYQQQRMPAVNLVILPFRIIYPLFEY